MTGGRSLLPTIVYPSPRNRRTKESRSGFGQLIIRRVVALVAVSRSVPDGDRLSTVIALRGIGHALSDVMRNPMSSPGCGGSVQHIVCGNPCDRLPQIFR